jgi:hypothetical protein
MNTFNVEISATCIINDWNDYKKVLNNLTKKQVAECNQILVQYMLRYSLADKKSAKNIGKYLKLVNSIDPKLTIDFWQSLCSQYSSSDICKGNMKFIHNRVATEIANAVKCTTPFYHNNH